MDKNSIKTSKFEIPSDNVFGVIGICGVVGNLIVRVLLENGYPVIGTDAQSPEDCHYAYTLKNYNFPTYLSGHPKEFFKSSDYLIPPPSLSKDSDLFKRIEKSAVKVLGVDDILEMVPPQKPVICITGTNGKTTTTHLLKHICRFSGFKTSEHGFKTLQGNVDYIPPLQARLNGDIAVLETGSGGKKGDLAFTLSRCQPTAGIITNINPDHLDDEQNFLNYARIKGEMLEELQGKKIILNADDPTIMGLLEIIDINAQIITFSVQDKSSRTASKLCWCGYDLKIEETISGVGYYTCICGLSNPKPDYWASEINGKTFKLHTPHGNYQVEMGIEGLHNIYNALAAIVAAKEVLKIPLNTIISSIKTFQGVSGRLEYLTEFEGNPVIVDYAHNPSGVETTLQELAKIYGSIAVVITISSESGPSGDLEIMNKALNFAEYIIPASYDAQQAAEKYIFSEKIISTIARPTRFREGTLGATPQQVKEGLKVALECEADVFLFIGEAAIKHKNHIKNQIDDYKTNLNKMENKINGEHHVH